MTKEDLGIKIGSPIELVWNNVKKNCETQLTQMEAEKLILEQNLELATKKLKELENAL